MAYVPSFEYDIFISYSHVDNSTATQRAAGWVERFHEYLQLQLGKRFGRLELVEIWRDENLTGDQLFDKVIQNRIDKSAIFLALTSHGYKKSDYCRQEVEWFSRKANREAFGLEVGERMRIFNICLFDIPYTEWPQEFGRTSGFPLYNKKTGALLEPGSRAFRERIRLLVEAIYEHLTSRFLASKA